MKRGEISQAAIEGHGAEACARLKRRESLPLKRTVRSGRKKKVRFQTEQTARTAIIDLSTKSSEMGEGARRRDAHIHTYVAYVLP